MVQLPAFLNHKTAAVKQGTKSSQYREEPQHTIQASNVLMKSHPQNLIT